MRTIKDHEFIRGDVPMTKEEIRSLSLIKLQIDKDSRILDVGAGTGSVSIAAAVNCPDGEVVSIEKEEKGIALIKSNIEKFELRNMKVIHGMGLEKMMEIDEKFNGIFIGGSGGELEKIIERSLAMLSDEGNLVMNFITMRNAMSAMDKLDEMDVEYECVQVGVNMVKGKSKMIMSHNPIFIINAGKNV